MIESRPAFAEQKAEKRKTFESDAAAAADEDVSGEDAKK